MSVVIKVENLSKQYRLGQVGTGTITHDVNRWWHKIRGKEDPYLMVGELNDRTLKGETDYVWALKDINFEVKKGEVLGIIGRNGAGKSTLLKILSRTTAPTIGGVKIKGRVASLLEVGTGFHPDLSGRDNIFLNGAILGMTRIEIQSKFDEIVNFAGVERYIDTPVKRYSSGMYVRLAFAVAAHLEPEILIIDEVLAVGDAEFQKKCLGKMKDVSVNQGRTVLFVTHNMAAVASLCTKVIFMEYGRVNSVGKTSETIAKYLKGNVFTNSSYRYFTGAELEGIFRLNYLKIKNHEAGFDESITEDKAIEFSTSMDIYARDAKNYHVTFHLFNELSEPIFSFSHRHDFSLVHGLNNFQVTFPENFFQSGNYTISFLLIKDKRECVYSDSYALPFTVVDSERDLGVYMGREPGYITPLFNWIRINND